MLKTSLVYRFSRFIRHNTSKHRHGKQWHCIVLFLFTTNWVHALPNEGYKVTKIATELALPWSALELAPNEWLITEREGAVVHVKQGQQTRTQLTLPSLYTAGQGGLLDVIKSPNFERDATLYVSFSQGNADANRLVVASINVLATGFSEARVIYSVSPDKDTPVHYAGRLLLLPDNTLLIASGDGFDYREKAQVVDNQLGKILRINLDGSVPGDNPFIAESAKSAHAVYSLGHRNPQGLTYDSASQSLYSHEHGPAGGDELNIIKAGENYGWPVITLGKDYSGARISPFTEYPSMRQPLVNWTPSIAPSSMAFYPLDANLPFASLEGHVLITTLVDKRLYTIDVQDKDFTQHKVFDDVQGRLRDVKVAANGDIAVLTDGNDAQLLILSSNN